MTLTERRAMLYNPDFWRILKRHMCPFPGSHETAMLTALAKSTKVSFTRVRAHYDRSVKAGVAITDGLTHPGTDSIN